MFLSSQNNYLPIYLVYEPANSKVFDIFLTSRILSALGVPILCRCIVTWHNYGQFAQLTLQPESSPARHVVEQVELEKIQANLKAEQQKVKSSLEIQVSIRNRVGRSHSELPHLS